MSTLERAIEIAVRAHEGQVDKAGGPYILHPLRVMMKMRTTEQRIAAVLHDVVEDSHWTIEGLRAEGFSEEILRAVESLTHDREEPYENAVRRAAADPIGRVVKKADLEDNLDLTRLSSVTEKDLARAEKYRRGLAIVLAAGGEV